MAFINQDQILGNIIPDVTISKITLETRGDILIESNPHVDHEREPNTFKDRYGRAKREKISPDFKNKSQSSQPLFVTLDLELREKLDDSLIGTWFNNQDFSKYLKLKIYQITKKEICKVVTEDKRYFEIVDKTRTVPLNKIRKDLLIGKLANKLGLVEKSFDIDKTRFSTKSNNNLDIKRLLKSKSLAIQTNHKVFEQNKLPRVEIFKFKKIIQDGVESKILSVDKDVVGDNSKITSHRTETDSEGNVINIFSYRVSFRIPTSNPQFLSYFAFSYLDLVQLATDFKMSLDIANFKDPIGKVVSDIVVDEGEIVGESFVFTDKDDRIWVGAIEEIGFDTFIGKKSNGEVISLTKKKVGNSKIQDFRNFEDLERLVLDFSILENELTNKIIKNPRKDNLGIKESETCFTNLNIARDDSGNARFFFALDFKRILQLNSKFGGLFSKRNASEIAMEKSHILSMKIFRKRIEGSSEAGSAPSLTFKPFNASSLSYGDNDIPEVIVVSGEKSFNTFKVINNSKGSLREVVGLSTTQDLSGVRHFTGIDKTMPLVTDGYYVYGVEIEVQDGIIQFLQEQVKVLEESKIELYNYYQEATQLAASRRIISRDDPHLDFPNEKRKEKNEERKGNFDPATNRFTQEFIRQQEIKYQDLDRVVQLPPWSKAVNSFIEVVEVFTDKEVPFSVTKSLLYFTHPATGNPSGILKLLNLIENLQKQIQSQIGFTSHDQGISALRTQKQNSTAKKSNQVRANSPTKTFKVNLMFKEIFNGNLDPQTGFDFLDLDELKDDFSGLKVVSGEQYNKRIERETNHYFIKPDGIKPVLDLKLQDQVFTQNDTIDNTSFSFLTPARVALKNAFSFRRLGFSPTPTFPREAWAQVGFGLRTFNVKPAANTKFKTSSSQILQNTTLNKKSEGLSNNLKNFQSKAIDYMSDFNIVAQPRPRLSLPPVTEAVFPLDPERPEKKIDSITEEKTKCSVETEIDPNMNPIPLLLELIKNTPPLMPTVGLPPPTRAQPVNLHDVGTRIKIIEPPKVLKNSLPASTIAPRFKNVSFNNRTKVSLRTFDITSRESAINKVTSDPTLVSSDMFFQGAFHTTTLNDALIKLPNQIKSLYLSRLNPSIVRKNWFSNDVDPLLSKEDETEFKFSYKLINTVLVFRGYATSKEGKLLIKQPLWEPLTLDIYNKSVGKVLFCRLKHYENKVIGLYRDKDMELPPFDEYFFLQPQKDVRDTNFKLKIPEFSRKTSINVLLDIRDKANKIQESMPSFVDRRSFLNTKSALRIRKIAIEDLTQTAVPQNTISNNPVNVFGLGNFNKIK